MMYAAIIPIGEARKENREPSHDGECLHLYWNPEKCEYGNPQWMLESNAGIEASHYHDFLDATRDANPDDEALAEAEEIQKDIDSLIGGKGSVADIERMGAEARKLARQWGWITKEV